MKKVTIHWLGLGSFFGFTALVLPYFHIVPSHGLIFRKVNRTWVDTFVDVAEYRSRVEQANYISRMFLKNSLLFKTLEARGVLRADQLKFQDQSGMEMLMPATKEVAQGK